MENHNYFSKRLTEILEYFGLSASAFADLIHVQRSSISHVLSGRNKPSLDFILKLNTACPDINLYWFLNGKGSMIALPSPPPTKNLEQFGSVKPNDKTLPNKDSEAKTIERIVVFYKNGTFDTYSDSNFKSV